MNQSFIRRRPVHKGLDSRQAAMVCGVRRQHTCLCRTSCQWAGGHGDCSLRPHAADAGAGTRSSPTVMSGGHRWVRAPGGFYQLSLERQGHPRSSVRVPTQCSISKRLVLRCAMSVRSAQRRPQACYSAVY